MLGFDASNAAQFLPPQWRRQYAARLEQAQLQLEGGTGAGAEFTGWLRLPEEYDREEFSRIKTAAKKIRAQSRTLFVIGIGGSYLGARGAIDLLCPRYGPESADAPEVCFVGNTLSSDAVTALLDLARAREFSVNVISKSGTTTEPAIAFRLFRALLEEKYGRDGARERIYATTDARRGALKSLADAQGYECFVVPDDVGGRYSVLTAVGLLPMAVAGIDIDAVMDGAAQECRALAAGGLENPAWQYAAARNALYEAGKKVEVLACYEPSFRFMGEWWKQLFGESEGKQGRGIFPASVEFTADLHSMGQYIQDGERMLFETVVRFDRAGREVLIPEEAEDGDGLNFLAGKTLDFVARQAMDGTLLAHVDGGVPNLTVHVPENDAACFGAMVYFFELSCALSGYLLGVNPFDQPGVEAYKRNMFALLDKPGYGELRAQLLEKMRGEGK